jgi:hypothetical protein
LYGSKSFKKHIKKSLVNANLDENIQEINDVKLLEETIQNDKLSIYLIDSDKIINKNIITDKLNFLKPKDAIYKHILQEAGIDDMCFNSDDALIEYIKDKITTSNVVEDIENIEEEEEKNMADITQLDEIFEDDLLSALDTEVTDITVENNIQNDDIIEKENILNNTDELQINSSNIDDVTALIKELLNNKTLELSIKIKAS